MPLTDEEYQDWNSRVPALVFYMEQNDIPLDEIDEYYKDSMLKGIQEAHKHLWKHKSKLGEENGS